MSCENINLCGGCTFRELTYNEQLTLKENKVKEALVEFFDEDTCFQSIVPSPLSFEYRNKMEFTFGDKEKNGDLMLGLHQKKTFYNILDASKCDLISDDLKDVVFKTINFLRNKNIKYYHKRIHRGYLRNLILRKSFYEN